MQKEDWKKVARRIYRDKLKFASKTSVKLKLSRKCQKFTFVKVSSLWSILLNSQCTYKRKIFTLPTLISKSLNPVPQLKTFIEENFQNSSFPI
jgi:hypothetical protein